MHTVFLRPCVAAGVSNARCITLAVASTHFAGRSRLWGLNKGDWPWLLLGLLGAIVAGGTHPSEGVFIAQVQVPYRTVP